MAARPPSVAALILGAAASSAFGGGGQWLNATSVNNDWSRAANWSSGIVPTSADQATFDQTATYRVGLSGDGVARNLDVMRRHVTFATAGHKLAVTDRVTVGGSLTASMYVTGGGTIESTGQVYVGDVTDGYLYVSEASHLNTAVLHVGVGGRAGHVHFTDGAKANISNRLGLGDSSNSATTGTLLIDAGAQVTAARMDVAARVGLSGAVTVNNATLNITGDASIGGSPAAAGTGAGTLTIGPGGLLSVGNRLQIWGSANALKGGAVVLDGGRIVAHALNVDEVGLYELRVDWRSGSLDLGGGSSNVDYLVVPANGTFRFTGTVTGHLHVMGTVAGSGTISSMNIAATPADFTGTVADVLANYGTLSVGTSSRLKFSMNSYLQVPDARLIVDINSVPPPGSTAIINLPGHAEFQDARASVVINVAPSFSLPEGGRIPLLTTGLGIRGGLGSFPFGIVGGRVTDTQWLTPVFDTAVADWFFPYAVDLMLALPGDARRDGRVNFTDLVVLAQNYNRSGSNIDWNSGDFTGDEVVNFADLVALAQNYGRNLASPATVAASADVFAADWALAQSLVPEPAAAGALASAIVMRRRRR